METASPLSLSLPTMSFHFLHRRRLLPVYSPPSSVHFTVILKSNLSRFFDLIVQYFVLRADSLSEREELSAGESLMNWSLQEVIQYSLYILLLYSYEQNNSEKQNLL